MKSKQSRNLIITAMSTLMLVNGVVPSYAINSTASIPEILAVGTVGSTVGAISTEVEEIVDDIVIEVLATGKVLTSEELVELGVSADLGGAPVYTEANGVAELVGHIEPSTDIVTYAEYEGFSEIIFKEQICYINSKYLVFGITDSLEDLPQLIEQEEVVEIIEEVEIVEPVVEIVEPVVEIVEPVVEEVKPSVTEYVVPMIETGESLVQHVETTIELNVDPLDSLISMGIFDENINNLTPTTDLTSNTTTSTSTSTSTTPLPSGKYAVVNSSTGLNLRASASTSSTVLAKLSNGTCADVIEVISGWAKVTMNGTTGYVSLDYVNLTDTKPSVTTTASSNSSSSVSTSSSSSSKGTEIVNFARKYIGTRYVYGGTSLTSGVDCSGFTYSVFKNFGINLNRTSKAQYSNGVAVSKANLQAGDLVFFNTGGNTSISHVGIYIGNNQYIHSTDGSGNGVCIASLNSAYALRTYYGARRVI
ncbi:MAG: SH3 domain-containing C40 family peptidase [bacterium]